MTKIKAALQETYKFAAVEVGRFGPVVKHAHEMHLERRLLLVEGEIHDAQSQEVVDLLLIANLKRQKLHLETALKQFRDHTDKSQSA